MSVDKLTCAQTFARLDEYLDRELTPMELAEVAQHLEACATCAGEFGVEAQLLDEIRRKLRRIRAPAELLAKISARLQQG